MGSASISARSAINFLLLPDFKIPKIPDPSCTSIFSFRKILEICDLVRFSINPSSGNL